MYDSWVGFKYNGKQYHLPFGSGAEWSITRGVLSINRPDLFGGQIFYGATGCAYLQPPGRSLDLPNAVGNCKLTEYGSPLRDSVGLYLYESGSLNMLVTSCDAGFGSQRSSLNAPCTIEGTFDLVLKNNENKTIKITDGEFHQY